MGKKIDFQETTNDLLTRIDIHNKFGSRDIDRWMLDTLDLKPGIRILDVACGGGKQCVSFHQYLNGKCEIVGGDISRELLDQAEVENAKLGNPFRIVPLDFDQRFEFPDHAFDLVSCCFAIYYTSDIHFTVPEMHRVLKSGGRLFTTGPMPENKRVFYDIIREATGKEIPPMPGSSRYSSEIYDEIAAVFAKVDTHIFENPLTFKTAAPFMAYARASMSEDRRLWKLLFATHAEFEDVMSKIHRVADKYIERDGEIVMTKVVGGFVATK